MSTMLTLAVHYWWAPAAVLLVAAYLGMRYVAKSKAKNAIIQYLDQADKSVFAAADVGVPVVADAVYGLLPAAVRMFVPRAVFDGLVGTLYAQAKAGVDVLSQPSAPVVATPSAVVAPAVTPSAPVTPVTSSVPDASVVPSASASPQK